MPLALRRRLGYARAWTRGALIEALHRPAPGGPPDGPGSGFAVVIDLREPSIERYLYTLARTFHEAGYAVHTSARPAYRHVENTYGRLTRTLPGGHLGRGRGADPARTLYVTDRPACVPNRPWRAVLPVDYDFYGAPADALVAPYTMHPLVYDRGDHRPSNLAALRARARSVGVLFLGNNSVGSYSSGPVVDVFRLTPRAPLLAKLDGLMKSIPAPADAPLVGGVPRGTPDDIAAGAAADQAVQTDGWRVADEEFLRALALASFFVAAPGVAIPHSHNIVEAMAVGTVPVTGYGHFMRPALTDREAVLFSGGDIREAVERALAMPEAERAEMSAAAAVYYDNHLSGAAFGRRVEAALAGPAPPGPLYIPGGRPTLRAITRRA
ncbi:glycosyltransferase [Rubrivirga litoralis]|uniref:Glycosyl transferases group 1 n=1 Tax=Rubrivirga litoralis TaxID=3075598 RepID=A0ABU3BSD4_9BACT|nr:hypothetical protein [Rubrivirga sp. F394]MDT0632206.1 hypothetical protein [Rubrivirga sp. F394]